MSSAVRTARLYSGVLLVAFVIGVSAAAPRAWAAPAAAKMPAALAGYRMPDLRGRWHSIAQYRGRPVILNLWAAWCAPCVRETPRLEKAYAAYRRRGIVVLGIDQGDSPRNVRSFAAKLHLTYPILLDRNEVFGAAAGFNFPTTVFVDRRGAVRSVHRGEIGSAELQRRMRSILLPYDARTAAKRVARF